MKIDADDQIEMAFHLGRASAAAKLENTPDPAFWHRLALQEFARAFNRLQEGTRSWVWVGWGAREFAGALWALAAENGNRAPDRDAVRKLVAEIARDAGRKLVAEIARDAERNR